MSRRTIDSLMRAQVATTIPVAPVPKHEHEFTYQRDVFDLPSARYPNGRAQYQCSCGVYDPALLCDACDATFPQSVGLEVDGVELCAKCATAYHYGDPEVGLVVAQEGDTNSARFVVVEDERLGSFTVDAFSSRVRDALHGLKLGGIATVNEDEIHGTRQIRRVS